MHKLFTLFSTASTSANFFLSKKKKRLLLIYMVQKCYIPKTAEQIQRALKKFEELRPQRNPEPRGKLSMTPELLQKIKQLMTELS